MAMEDNLDIVIETLEGVVETETDDIEDLDFEYRKENYEVVTKIGNLLNNLYDKKIALLKEKNEHSRKLTELELEKEKLNHNISVAKFDAKKSRWELFLEIGKIVVKVGITAATMWFAYRSDIRSMIFEETGSASATVSKRSEKSIDMVRKNLTSKFD